MSLAGDDGTKHDINPSMVRSCNHTSSSEGFTIHDAYSRLYKRPILGNHCLFHVFRNEHWERISGFGLRETEFFSRIAGTRLDRQVA